MSGRPYRVGSSCYIHALPSCCLMFGHNTSHTSHFVHRFKHLNRRIDLHLGIAHMTCCIQWRCFGLSAAHQSRWCITNGKLYINPTRIIVSDRSFGPRIPALESADDLWPQSQHLHTAKGAQAWAQYIIVAGTSQTLHATISSVDDWRPHSEHLHAASDAWAWPLCVIVAGLSQMALYCTSLNGDLYVHIWHKISTADYSIGIRG